MTLRRIKAATSLGELAKACKSAARTIDADVNKIKVEAALELSFRLIYETPVDTSQALSNWVVTYAVPSSARRFAFKVGEQGSTKNYSAAQAYRQAKNVLTRIPPKIDVFVSNNLSYIHKLNMGGSQQQPTAYYIERIEQAVGAKAQRRLKDYLNGN